VLRKRDVIVSAVNSRVRKISHKYGIELPTSVKHAIEIDRKNGNTLWQDALSKEMGNVCVAFEILGPNMKAPLGWHKASGHLVFDVKMDFTKKRALGQGWAQNPRLCNVKLGRNFHSKLPPRCRVGTTQKLMYLLNWESPKHHIFTLL